MIQQRKKDYLQRLIEEFFSKLNELKDSQSDSDLVETKLVLKDCFEFFSQSLDILQSDNVDIIIKKVNDVDLLEQYAKLLLTKYELVDIKDVVQLHLALDIVNFIEATSTTYSWDTTILKEDILRLLSI